MLLENKVAVIYGAGGSIGGAVARAFTREGARVYLAGHTRARLETMADEIRAAGGAADVAEVDALDEQAVDAFADAVAAEAGSLDIAINLIGYSDVQKPLIEISLEEFFAPIQNAMRSQFLTSRAAARQMVKQGSGVILFFGGGGPQTQPGLGGFKVTLDAIESLRRQLACELGPNGIRVVTLKTGGVPETLPEGDAEAAEIAAKIREATLLKRAATLADVGNVAVFVASDLARTLTATWVNISGGALAE